MGGKSRMFQGESLESIMRTGQQGPNNPMRQYGGDVTGAPSTGPSMPIPDTTTPGADLMTPPTQDSQGPTTPFGISTPAGTSADTGAASALATTPDTGAGPGDQSSAGATLGAAVMSPTAFMPQGPKAKKMPPVSAST
jgi:hypothetical protein